MIHFRTCKFCGKGEWEPPRYGPDGEIEIYPSVRCEVCGESLLMNSEVPEKCPYILEHKLAMQSVSIRDADRLSGGSLVVGEFDAKEL
jgi:hypothetical protein